MQLMNRNSNSVEMEKEFSGRIRDINTLIEPMLSIDELIDEGTFEVSEEGLRLRASDRAWIVVVDFLCKRHGFNEYKFKQNTKIGVGIQQFVDVLKRFNAEVMIECTGDKIHIFDNLKSFELPILDISQRELPPIGKLEFSGSLVIGTDLLREWILDAKLIGGDSITFEITKNKALITNSTEISSFSVELDGTEWNFKNDVKSSYYIDYFKKILKSNVSDKTRLRLSDNCPINIEQENELTLLSWTLANTVDKML